MVYSFKTVTVAANVAVTKRIAYRLILSASVLGFAACGVRGPLTVNPKPIKGLDGVAAPTPTDLRAVPSSAVLYGSDGKQTLIVPPASKTE
jgi:predicted small lipoprotein YifL